LWFRPSGTVPFLFGSRFTGPEPAIHPSFSFVNRPRRAVAENLSFLLLFGPEP